LRLHVLALALVALVALAACARQGGPARAVDMEVGRGDAARGSEAPPAAAPHVELQATMAGVCELAGGVVRCAGRNMWGEIGDGTREPHREWARVPGIDHAVQLAAGGHHVCVRLEDRTAQCWGDNAFAQLGDGVGGEPRTAPVTVVGVHDIEELRAGSSHTCARLRGGDVLCWGGMIDSVQIPFDLDPTSRLRPTRIVTNASRLVAGHERSYAKTPDGWVTWAPQRGPPPIPLVMGALDDAVAIALGIADDCAATAHGEVRCWGASHPSTHPRRYEPDLAQAIPGLPPVTKVTVGRAHACALVVDGRVYCWGELHGYVPKPPSSAPVAGITDAVDVTAGFDFTCARLRNGSVKCWGTTDYLPEETALEAPDAPGAPGP
jgi:hypothetical protein